MVSQAIKRHNKINPYLRIAHLILHTGQHYDFDMNDVFFAQLKIPNPKCRLYVGSGTHGKMTGDMLIGVEKVLIKERPDWVLVYGDTNTTLAGAFAAAKIPLPVAHVEAGLRSYNRDMPEEINRVLTDHLACILFCPTDKSIQNLKGEGIVERVYKVGDVMYDSFIAHEHLAMRRSNLLKRLKIRPKNYCLATVHRQENTDKSSRLLNIFKAFDELAKERCPFIVPLHPRTRKALRSHKICLSKNKHIRFIQPANYLDLLALELQAKIILTDSGGIQKEAFFARVPCITLRDETEWVETVESGWNQLCGADPERIINGFNTIKKARPRSKNRLFGQGNASELIVRALVAASPFDLTARKIKNACSYSTLV